MANKQQALHKNIPSFSPYIPVAFLPYLAFPLLAATFVLTFYFSTYVPTLLHTTTTTKHCCCRIPKSTLPVHELLVASLASVLGGFGVVALFCSVGVYL